MGFFDSSVTTDSKSTYDNPELRKYTQGYMAAAPWGFATLDPTATLMAMGGTTKVGGVDLGQNMKDYLGTLSAQDKKTQTDTNDALARIKERQDSGQFLTESETKFINTSLDQAFAYAHQTGITDWTKATQQLAGSRGLRMSDTPVAQPAMNSLRDFELGLGSQRAQAGLTATLQMSQQQQAFDQSFAQFNQSLQQQKWATQQGFLFGGGLSAAGNLGFTTTNHNTTTTNPSGFSNFMSGLQMANGVMDFGKKAGGSLMSMGSMTAPMSANGASGLEGLSQFTG